MKESYIYENGKIIVVDKKDDNLILKKYDYQDNIGDIFSLENILEVIDTNKNVLNSQISYFTKYFSNVKKTYLKLFVFTYILVLALCCCCSLIDVSNLKEYFEVGLFLSPVTSFCELFIKIHEDRKNKRILKAMKLELKYLEDLENESKKKLEILKSNKIKSNEETINNSKVKKNVEYKEQLMQMKKELDFYFELGKNEKKYQKYYNKNILDKKMDIENSDKVKTYFKSKK